MLRKISSLSLLVALFGCTTSLTHEPLPPDVAQARPGFLYYLPKQSFAITVTYELTGCPDRNSTVEAERNEEFTVVQKATIVESSVPDPTQHYYIPYEDLDSLLKNTTFTASIYPNGTIKSIGATVEDRSAQIIKNIVGTAVSVAKMSMGANAAANAVAVSLCSPSTYMALRASQKAQALLLDPAVTDKDRAAAAAVLVTAKTGLQYSRTEVFSPANRTELRTRIDGSLAVQSWLNYQAEGYTPKSTDEKFPDEIKKLIEGNYFARHLITEVSLTPDLPEAPKPVVKSSNDGVVFREPARGILKVCRLYCGSGDPPLVVHEAWLGQLGRYSVVSLRNGVFDKNTVTMAFAPNGQMESLSYGSESRLEKISGALNDAAAQAQSLLTSKNAADKARADAAAGAELSSIKAETDLLKAKGDKIEAQRRLITLGGQ